MNQMHMFTAKGLPEIKAGLLALSRKGDGWVLVYHVGPGTGMDGQDLCAYVHHLEPSRANWGDQDIPVHHFWRMFRPAGEDKGCPKSLQERARDFLDARRKREQRLDRRIRLEGGKQG